MSKALITIALIVLVICFCCCEVNALVCPENICENSHCDQVDESICSGPDKLVKKGGFCLCCDTCFTVVGLGEYCGLALFGLPPSSLVCKEGLYCMGGFCVEKFAI